MPSEPIKHSYYSGFFLITKTPLLQSPKFRSKWYTFRGGAPTYFLLNGFETPYNTVGWVGHVGPLKF